MIDISRQKSLFPLKNFDDVEKLFKYNLDEANGEPNLALLSVVAGLIEHSLVTITDRNELQANSRPVSERKDVAHRKFGFNQLVNSSSQQPDKKHRSNEVGHVVSCSGDSSERSSACSSPDYTSNDNLDIPEIEYEVVETLYKRFVDQVKGNLDTKGTENQKTNLRIKEISDSVWKHLSNSYYKDKTHLQSIFSYLITSKLDCFGLAFAVIAGCQILNLKNIYLALSEDHAWVMFDLKQDELRCASKEREIKEYLSNNIPVPTCVLHGTCEVTWHGKANSDKRGQAVTYKNCWLYTNGYAVKCDTRQCVVALVNSMNPSINSNTDSEILALLQQRLLWRLYHENNYFPMSLGNLGELEDLCPTPDAPMTAHELFNLGIEIARKRYFNSHVYPYTYLASFFFKHGRFKEALETWADSSAVMTKYNYSRDDEEIYKEFFEVANELIPSMLKVLTAGGLEPGKVSLKPFLQDPECLALIVKFYDNICCWEEGSSTPVLHIGWAKNFVATILKFSSIVRSKIKLYTEEEWSQSKASTSEYEVASSRADQCSSTASDHLDRTSENSPSNSVASIEHQRGGRLNKQSAIKREKTDVEVKVTATTAASVAVATNDEENMSADDMESTTSSTTISLNDERSVTGKSKKRKRPNAAAAAVAGRLEESKLLDGNDSTKRQKQSSTGIELDKCNATNDEDTIEEDVLQPREQEQQQDLQQQQQQQQELQKQEDLLLLVDEMSRNFELKLERRLEFDSDNSVAVILRSRKIAGVRDLLKAERLNKTAIELQLTAQSQCAVRGRSNSSTAYSCDFISSQLVSITGGSTTRSKRAHR